MNGNLIRHLKISSAGRCLFVKYQKFHFNSRKMDMLCSILIQLLILAFITNSTEQRNTENREKELKIKQTFDKLAGILDKELIKDVQAVFTFEIKG
jgi:hypothetical protein